jgi:hypothetical protein
MGCPAYALGVWVAFWKQPDALGTVVRLLRKKNKFEGQMWKIGILRILAAKMDFSCF